jgi:hypothetical protein
MHERFAEFSAGRAGLAKSIGAQAMQNTINLASTAFLTLLVARIPSLTLSYTQTKNNPFIIHCPQHKWHIWRSYAVYDVSRAPDFQGLNVARTLSLLLTPYSVGHSKKGSSSVVIGGYIIKNVLCSLWHSSGGGSTAFCDFDAWVRRSLWWSHTAHFWDVKYSSTFDGRDIHISSAR